MPRRSRRTLEDSCSRSTSRTPARVHAVPPRRRARRVHRRASSARPWPSLADRPPPAHRPVRRARSWTRPGSARSSAASAGPARPRATCRVACSRPTLTRLLHTTGFDRIVPVTETLDAAGRGPAQPSRDRPRLTRQVARLGRPMVRSVVAEQVASRSRSRPSRSCTSVGRNGTRTTGAGAHLSGQAGEVLLLAGRRPSCEVGQVGVEAAEVGAGEASRPARHAAPRRSRRRTRGASRFTISARTGMSASAQFGGEERRPPRRRRAGARPPARTRSRRRTAARALGGGPLA